MAERCDTVRVHLGAWLDEELSAGTVEKVERHLAVCPACRAEAAALRRLTQAVGSLSDPAPSHPLRARVLAQASADLQPSRTETWHTEHDGARRVARHSNTPLAGAPSPTSEPFLSRVVLHQWQISADGGVVRHTTSVR